MSFATRLTDLVYSRRRWLMIGFLLGAIGLGVMARNIGVDNSLEVWFVEGDPALVAYEQYKQRFGNDEVIIIAAGDPDGVYTPEALQRIRAASTRIEQHPKIRRVISITQGLHAHGVAGAIEIERLLPDGPITDEIAADVRKRVEQDPAFRGVIAGKDDRMTALIAELKTLDDIDAERPALLADVRTIVAEELQQGDGVAHLGGIGVIYEGLNAASMRDSGVFITLSYLILLAGLWLLFRRVAWVLVGTAIVSVAILATMGVAGAAGRDLNMVTAVLPTLIMTIGILDLVHLIEAYEGASGGAGALSPRRILLDAVAIVVVPCIVNSLTDAAGFLALTSAKMDAVRDLGWLASVGLLILLGSVLVFGIPALARYGKQQSGPRPAPFIMAIVRRCGQLAERRRWTVLMAAAALLAVAGVGISRLQVDTYTIGFLDEDDPVRRDYDAIQEKFGDHIPLELTVTTAEPDGLKDPEVMERLDRAERRFETHPEVSRATGVVEIVKRVNQIYFDEDPEAYAVPQRREIIAEELFTYAFDADARDNLDAVVDPDFRIARITTRGGLPNVAKVRDIIEDLEAAGAEELGDHAKVKAAGYLPLYVRIIHHITDTQVNSFALVFAVVSLILIVLLRSVKLGLIAMLPNLVPAVVTLGFMGFVGIRLDVATVLIAAIAIGISVNDTTHIMFRYRHELEQTPADPVGAMRRMLEHAGRPVVASSLLLIAGFSVLLFASVKSISYFGLLSAATVLTALVADLLFTPALLLVVSRAPVAPPADSAAEQPG